MTVVDRLNGINSGLGMKAPVRAATTANISLSGEQTIDGIALIEDDRVLVKNQTSGVDNGIYNVNSGPWTRATDFNGIRDTIEGTCVFVAEGTANSGAVFYLQTTSPVIGTSSLTFSRSSNLSLIETVSSITEATDYAIYSDETTTPGTPTLVKLPLSKTKATKSLRELGAIGDGSTAETLAAVNANIATAFAAGIRRFDGLDKTYKFTGSTALVIPPGAELYGFYIDASGMDASSKAIRSAGTQGTAVALTANLDVAAYIVTVGDTSTFSAGQPVYIKRDTNFHSFASADIGELNRVRKVIDATTLWLYWPSTFSFPTSDNATIAPITASNDLTYIHDGELTGKDTYGHDQYAMYFQYLDGVQVERIRSSKFDQVHCDFYRCLHSRGVRNSFKWSNGLLAYGYLHENGTRDSQISGGDCSFMRHGSATGSGSAGGVQIDILLDGLHVYNAGDAGIDFHGTTIGCYVDNCTVHGDMGQHDVERGADASDGIISEGINTRFSNCVVKNVNGSGFKIQPLSDTNTFFGGGYGTISDCYAEGTGTAGFELYMANAGPTIDRVVMRNILARGCDTTASSAAIRAYVATGCTVNELVFDNARSVSAGADGMQIRATGTGIIGTATVNNANIKGSAGIDAYCLVDGGDVKNITFRGGKFDGGASATAQFYVLASSGGDIETVDINGVNLKGGTRGAYVRATGAGSTIGTVKFRDVYARSITGENLFAQADSSGVNTTVSFNSNNTDGGTYGLRASGPTTVITDGRNVLGTHSTSVRSFATVTNLYLGPDIGVTIVPAQATIATGVATIAATHEGHMALVIDTEAAAATDDLDTLTLTGVRDGQVVTLRAYSSSREVVAKDGAGNMNLAGDMTMDNHEDSLTLQWSSTDSYWYEISRSGNGA